MTEKSGCRKTQHIRELLANPCSDEDCFRQSLRSKFMQGLFNGKPKAPFPLSFDETVAFGLPLNEFMRPLWKHSQRAVVTRKMSARSILAVCTGFLAGAFALTALCGVTQVMRSVIQVARGDGMLVIAVDDPEVHVLIDHGTFEISGARSEAIHLRPGKHQVLATRRGIPFRNEDITITRRGKRVLRIEQKPADSASTLIPLRGAKETQ